MKIKRMALWLTRAEARAVEFACRVNRDIIANRIEEGNGMRGDRTEVRRLEAVMQDLEMLESLFEGGL